MRIKQEIIDLFKRFCKKSKIAYTTINVFIGDDRIIGAIQTVNFSKRQDNHYTISAYRGRFDRSRLSEIFCRNFIDANSQKFPLKIEIDDGDNIVTIINAWITSSGYSYQSNDWIILDSFEMEAETIDVKKSDTFSLNAEK